MSAGLFVRQSAEHPDCDKQFKLVLLNHDHCQFLVWQGTLMDIEARVVSLRNAGYVLCKKGGQTLVIPWEQIYAFRCDEI